MQDEERRVWIRRAAAAAAALVLCLLAFLAGRFTAPVRVTEASAETKLEERHAAQLDALAVQRTESKTEARVQRRVVHTVRRPDGTVERTRTEETASQASQGATAAASQVHAAGASEASQEARQSVRVVEGGKPWLRLAALGGAGLGALPALPALVWGGEVSVRPLPLPVWVGVFGMSNGVAGLTVGIEF